MNAKNNGPAPELHVDRNPEPEPASELLIQYPRSEPIAVTLSRQTFWDEVAGTEEKLPRESVPAPELSASLSWAAVAAGVLLAGALWSAILF